MKARITSISKEQNKGALTIEDIKDIKILTGINASMCYMKGSYDDIIEKKTSEKLQRMTEVISGERIHHAINDHINISICFEGISKWCCILLNSLHVYATCEKSGRYTEMTPNTEQEKEMYHKWIDILTKRIKTVYPDMEDAQINKLAMENARGMLSITTESSNMVYTTDIRTWNYILYWLEKWEEVSHYMLDETFTNPKSKELFGNVPLLPYSFLQIVRRPMFDLYEAIDSTGVGVSYIGKPKKPCFGLVQEMVYLTEYYSQNSEMSIDTLTNLLSEVDNIDVYADSVNYVTRSYVSYIAFADEIRHRSIDYSMSLSHTSVFIPYILDAKESEEWILDMAKVKQYSESCFIQADMVLMEERGTLENLYYSKASERLCGAPQLEVAHDVAKTIISVAKCLENVDGFYADKIKSLTKTYGKVKPKCAQGYPCSQKCYWMNHNINPSSSNRRI